MSNDEVIWTFLKNRNKEFPYSADREFIQDTWGQTGEEACEELIKRRDKTDTALVKVAEAATRLGLQCQNIGNYGPLKIRPGECTCSTCEMKNALDNLRKTVRDV